MPVNTRAKRSSAINLRSPWRGLWPAPDASVGQGDRQAVAFLYSGILASGAIAVQPHRRLTLLKIGS